MLRCRIAALTPFELFLLRCIKAPPTLHAMTTMPTTTFSAFPSLEQASVAAVQRVDIALGERSYPILIGQGLLGSAEAWQHMPGGTLALIVTNTTVQPLYAAQLAAQLASGYARVRCVALPDGEQYKNSASLAQIFDALIAAGADRKSVVYALGGGVVGDMAGFAAACYMRGISFVQVPTTLLAQVDSSVGGKTAINHARGKNLIGAFHQPRAVLCDLGTLHTLPARELSAGLAEVIKYGPIADMEFFAWLEEHMHALRACEGAALAHAVQRSCQIKADVVARDECETGLRAILNFGHTFGHAIEAGMGYGRWLHGEAVAAGMCMAAHLSCALGLAGCSLVRRLEALLARAGLPTRGPVLDERDNAGRYLALMRLDKKSEGGAIRFITIERPGRAALRTAPDALVREVIDHCCAAEAVPAASVAEHSAVLVGV